MIELERLILADALEVISGVLGAQHATAAERSLATVKLRHVEHMLVDLAAREATRAALVTVGRLGAPALGTPDATWTDAELRELLGKAAAAGRAYDDMPQFGGVIVALLCTEVLRLRGLIDLRNEALQTILDGAEEDGRWIVDDECACQGTREGGPGEGYYDADNPPEGYNAEGWALDAETRQPAGEELIPARWEPYTAEEQATWLRTCARHARDALGKTKG